MSRADSPLRDRMIFLVGARRSGTNWLQRVVGAHPEVALVPSETYLFSYGIQPLRDRFHHGVRGSPGTAFIYMDEHELLDALRDFCDRALMPYLREESGARRLAERTPDHVSCLELIGSIYPDAHVVNIVRDGRDVVRSLLSQTWESAPRTVEEAAEEWRSSVEAAEKAAGAVPLLRTVQYEHLLADPLRSITDLYGWLGLSTRPDVVEGALTEAEVRFNVDPSSPAIAEGKWRETFADSDLDAFMRVGGATLERYGYDTSHGSAAPARVQEAPAKERRAPATRRRGRKGRGGDTAGATFQRDVVAHVTLSQQTLDRIIAAINTRQVERLRSMTMPTVWVRVIGPAEDWKGRGEAALARLLATIEADEALTGRQVDGDLHAALPTSTAVMRFVDPKGKTHVRVVAVTLQGDAIARLTYYRMPLA